MKKSLSYLLTVVIALFIVFLLNFLASEKHFRLDLTSEKRYTLHDETKKLLSNLDEKVFVKVYLDSPELPVQFKRMRRSIEELLDEFKRVSDDKLEFVFVNPTESDDKAVRFALYKQLHLKGLTPIESQMESSTGKTSQVMLFPGAIISYAKKEAGVNLLKTDSRSRLDSEENINHSVESLEYEFTNAIRKLSMKEKPKIAFLEGHGEISEFEVMDVTRTLSEYYDVQRGKIGGQEGILDGFSALIVAQPTLEFTKKDKYIIDQYIMNGGKVLWLVDGVQNKIDSLTQSDVVALANEVGLINQLFRYGARVNPNLVQDLQCTSVGLSQQDKSGHARIQLHRWPFFPILVSQNDHVINKYIEPIRVEYVSSVDTVGANPNVEKTVLLRTSKFSKVSGVPIHLDLNDAMKPIEKEAFKGKSRPVAVLMEGRFESAFKNRPVSRYTDNPSNFRKESMETKMIVVGSGSMARNEVSPKGEIIPVGFDRAARRTFNGNREFILNAVNYLCDDRGVMSIRNREIKLRLLDRERISKERGTWQLVNVALPIVVFIIFGVIYFIVRHYRFGRKK